MIEILIHFLFQGFSTFDVIMELCEIMKCEIWLSKMIKDHFISEIVIFKEIFADLESGTSVVLFCIFIRLWDASYKLTDALTSCWH